MSDLRDRLPLDRLPRLTSVPRRPTRRERKLERQAHAALDAIEAALYGEDGDRAFAAAAIVVVLNRRSVYRDVRPELVKAAELLRVPPGIG